MLYKTAQTNPLLDLIQSKYVTDQASIYSEHWYILADYIPMIILNMLKKDLFGFFQIYTF